MTAPTPYYSDDHVTLYHGDSNEILPHIVDNSAHVVITDPPYFRVVDADWDDQWGADPAEFLRWIGQIVEHSARIAVERGALAMFCSPDLACGVELEVRRRMNFLNHIVWRKPLGRLGRMDKASMRRFFPTSERIIIADQARNPDGDLFRFTSHVNHRVAEVTYAPIREQLADLRDRAKLTHKAVDAALGTNGMAGHYFGGSQWCLPTAESYAILCQLFTAAGVVDFPTWDQLRSSYEDLRREFDTARREFDSHKREFDSARRDFNGSNDIELLSDVWTFGAVLGKERTDHPTQKPMALMRHLITTLSRPGDLILDPFTGSGTTLRAAKDLGRRAVGIEMSEQWCEVTATRLAQEALPLFAGAPSDVEPIPSLFAVT